MHANFTLRARCLYLAALPLTAFLFSPSSAQAPARDLRATIDPARLPLVGTIDPRFQSYNIEMVEVTGGAFWKPYGSHVAAKPDPANAQLGVDSSQFEYRPPIDLANARLRLLARALGPAYVRVSGTWANSVYFAASDSSPVKAPDGFKGVLTRQQWRGVIAFAKATNSKIVTSFAISPGTRDSRGSWTPDEARRWLAYTRAIGGTITAAEFMNEPSIAGISGAPKGYDAAAYGRDFQSFRAFAKREAPGMLILGPGSATETPEPWGMPPGIPGSIPSPRLLASGGADIDAFSYHHYGAASVRCAASHMPQTTLDDALSEQWLGRTSETQAYYAALRDRYAPGRPIWMTEGADAACGGNPWAGSFIDSFRYLDQLGRLAKAHVQVVMHNTLAAGSYSLLDPDDFSPKANYWAALLWHRLMGTTVLDAGIPLQPGLHVYAHCQPDHPGGVTLLVINTHAAREVSISFPGRRWRYTLSAPVTPSTGAKLNGQSLKLGANNRLPPISGIIERSHNSTFAPRTISFLAFPEAGAPACSPH
ncbi:hypothetical protein MTR62_18130 [Novosphingobium sp. 1949]|uniref:Glycosyl hydrolase family 79 n=1 Tax=Novosphingobium organovorum TaxID=2930092 RepID=A0ABT0BHS2_9SPHN|nr:hypothetical protein [Novosphingobium organovorum]MCJ2184592.1 hypothetical protein [Novosphingobium organovorum]